MNWELILTIISSVATLAAIIIGYYQYIKKKLEQEALNAINEVEQGDKVGSEKMKEAIQIVNNIIPVVARPFINDQLIESIIQGIFDKVEEYARKQIQKDSNNKK